MAVGYGLDALEIISVLMRTCDSPAVKLAAAREMLDRAYGKPGQEVRPVGAYGSFDITKLTDEQLRLGQEIARAAAIGVGDVD